MMTDKERQELIQNLYSRGQEVRLDAPQHVINDARMKIRAANEIKQLAEAVKFWQVQADIGHRYIEAYELQRGDHTYDG